MSDSVQQDQLQENNKPEIKCKLHTSCNYLAINQKNTNIQNILVCVKCIREQQIDFNDLVLIDDIQGNYNQNVIQNLVQFNDNQIGQFQAKDIEDFKVNEEIEKVKSIFDKFQKNIQKMIEHHKESILSQIHVIEEKKQDVLKIFSQVTKIEQIRQQFTINEYNLKEIQYRLDELISEKNGFQQLNEKEIQQKLDDYNKSLQNFNINNIGRLLFSILIQIKSNLNSSVEIDFSQQNYENQLSKITSELQDNVFENKNLTQEIEINLKQLAQTASLFNMTSFAQTHCYQDLLNEIYQPKANSLNQLLQQQDISHKNQIIHSTQPFQANFKSNELKLDNQILQVKDIQEIKQSLNDNIKEKDVQETFQ